MRKSQQILALEAHFDRPIAEIVADAYTCHQTIDAAAAALTKESGIPVNPNTFGYWLVRLTHVETRKVASVA